MNPEEVRGIFPFLKEKYISRIDFFTMLKSGYTEKSGMDIKRINADMLGEFLSYICRNRLHKVDSFSVDNGRIVYYAGTGDNAFYLLTAVLKGYEGGTEIFLSANSDKKSGLNGFLNEFLEDLRNLSVNTGMQDTGIIGKERVIEILDSIAQFEDNSSARESEAMNIRDFHNANTEKDRKKVEELSIMKGERPGYNEKEALHNEKEKKRITASHYAEKRMKEDRSLRKKLLAAIIILGIIAVGYFAFMKPSNPDHVNVPATRPNIVYVEIKGSRFDPDVLRISQGTTVRWTNMDSALHQVRGDDFESPELNKRDTWSYTFDKKGTYNYSCIKHPYMANGTIIST